MKLTFLYIFPIFMLNTIASECNADRFDVPLIVWWTDRLYPHVGTSRKKIRCTKGYCWSTKNSYIRRNDIISGYIFYGSDMDVGNLPLPRKKNDLWALIHEESPMNNYLFSHSAGIRLFNYTSTFRRESDYPLTTQFVPSLNYLTDRKPYPLEKKNELRRNGFAPAVYVQSHCEVASDRDRYVRELSKYIDIDSYGACLHNRDLPEELATTEQYESESFLSFISQYKFHLAFENAICDDYMTEKLFRALHVGSVPVYKGSPKANDWMPDNKSLIFVDDFDSPRSLAEYLLHLDRSDEEYNSYMKYKFTKEIENNLLKESVENRDWGVNDIEKIDFLQGFECYFCDKLIEHQQTKLTSDSSNIYSLPKTANQSHMGCPQPHPSLAVELPSADEWIEEAWVDSYWFGLDVALALQKMIASGENKSTIIYQYLQAMKYSH